MDDRKICGVIVTYRCEYDKLLETVTSIAGQVDHVCLVDNNGTRMPDIQKAVFEQLNCTIISNLENVGLAKAINQGIRFSAERHFRQVLLMDQDSRAASNMVDRLTAAGHLLSGRNKKIGALGPVIMDRLRGEPFPFLQYKPTHIRKIQPFEDEVSVPVDYLITSGSLLEIETLSTVGLMDESLFIDGIDQDWCFRAQKAGYGLYGVSGAFLYHSLGDSGLRLPFTNRVVFLHQPERQYYIIRNRLWLYRRHYIPFNYKIHDALRVVFRLFFFSILAPRRLENARMMIRGIVDGLSGCPKKNRRTQLKRTV